MISWILPMTVVALMFKYMFSDQWVINYILTSLHYPDKEPIEYLNKYKKCFAYSDTYKQLGWHPLICCCWQPDFQYSRMYMKTYHD